MRDTLPKKINKELAQTTLATLQTFTDKQVYNEIAKLEQTLTPKEILLKKPVLISLGVPKVSIITEIIRIIEFFLEVTNKELAVYQIQILAGDLYEKFRTDTLEDLILFFKMARQGEFGKVYKCDSLEIMSWIPQYFDRKSAIREMLIAQNKRKRERAAPEPEPAENTKQFHELPKELQEKFNNLGMSKMIITKKAQDFLVQEKNKREINKLI